MTGVGYAEPVEPEGKSFLESFVVGDYALIGQFPDSTITYSGVARIDNSSGSLTLTRQIGKQSIKATGRIEAPHPPGEGSVIRFRWIEKEPTVMSCLASGDLDNYARLTCYVVVEGQPHLQPGIEALFPMATWPTAPNKALKNNLGDAMLP